RREELAQQQCHFVGQPVLFVGDGVDARHRDLRPGLEIDLVQLTHGGTGRPTALLHNVNPVKMGLSFRFVLTHFNSWPSVLTRTTTASVFDGPRWTRGCHWSSRLHLSRSGRKTGSKL